MNRAARLSIALDSFHPAAGKERISMAEIITITTTADNRETLEQIGRVLVEERLAACAQIMGPIKSIYHWKGDIEEAEEWLCIIKTRSSLYKEVEKAIKDAHPYELPEIVAFKADNGLPGYLSWVHDETLPP
jgi:periplasmic divalent cation tolerance protein